MNISLKKKLSVAILAGCSIVAFSGISFAAQPTNCPPPPAYHHQIHGDFAKMPPPPPEHQQYKKQYKDYCEQFASKYSWSESSIKRAAMNFVSVDKALAENKLSEAQATSLKKELTAFYKEREKYANEMQNLSRDDRRAYHDRHLAHLSLDRNIPEIAEKSNIPAATVAKVLRPHGKDRRDFQPPPQRPSFQQMHERAKEMHERVEAITNELVSEGKITNEEVAILGQYMKDSHEKFVNMSDDERSAYMDKVRNLSDDERLAQISKDTGISTDRLTAIFEAVKEKMHDNFTPQNN